MVWRMITFLFTLVSAGTVLAAASLLYNSEKDRASFTISEIRFDPFPLVANNRTYVAFGVKNTGSNYGTIIAGALHREVDPLPPDPAYVLAQIDGVNINGGEQNRFISDLSDKPLIFTQPEINGLSNGRVELKMVGFIAYKDKYPFLGESIVGFCYVWNPRDTPNGNFDACSEKSYTYAKTYWPWQSIQIRQQSNSTSFAQTISPTTVTPTFTYPKSHIKTLK